MKKLHLLWGLIMLAISGPALAVPSFARQTGQDCAACHIGSYGPQLTPYGMKFKMGGYTESDGKEGHIPLSAMLVESFTNTKKDQSEVAAEHFGKNNNASLQEVSVFVAGRFTENIGAFSQITWSEPDRKTSMDNFDVRLVKSMQIGGNDTVFGISLNNNPTVQDPFNSAGWKFPFIGSELAPTPTAGQIIAGGLETQVFGTTAYALYDNHWYAELGGYKSFSKNMLNKMNIDSTETDKISGVSPYWRLAYFNDMHKSAYNIGLFGMNTHILPGREAGITDKYTDIGIDGSYQFLGTREHVMTVNGSYTHEHRQLDASFLKDSASQKNGHLDRFDVNTSYHYDKTYGLTAGFFDIRGNKDSVLYAATDNGDPIADSGSRTNSPNSRGYTLQADWTPLGKEQSWGAPFANMRFAVQYTGYTKFNGAKNNYDGVGRNASDNNTLYTSLWFAL